MWTSLDSASLRNWNSTGPARDRYTVQTVHASTSSLFVGLRRADNSSKCHVNLTVSFFSCVATLKVSFLSIMIRMIRF